MLFLFQDVRQFVRQFLSIMLLLCWVVAYGAENPQQEVAIQWYHGSVEQAFAEAKNQRKPIFLYWGAVWCPPCNQLKATLFKNPAFVGKTRLFVPVYLDGDTESAQKLGEQFGVLGYPTMILFSPDGEEITRLPGGMSLDLYPQMLDLALDQVKPVARILHEIIDQGRKPRAQELHLLAYYSWQQDGGKAVGKRDLFALLKKLSELTPEEMVKEKVRFQVEYLSLLATRDQPLTEAERQSAIHITQAILESADLVRDNFYFPVYDMEELLPRLSCENSPERKALLAAWHKALLGLKADKNLSKAQQLNVYTGLLHWMKLAGKPIDAAFQQEVAAAVARARQHLADGHERIAVNYAAYGALQASAQEAQAQALINNEIQAGSNDQYWMLVLADLAKQSGQAEEALSWYAKAWETARGGATRVQWGSYYIRELTQQAPDQEARIVKVSEQLFALLKTLKTPFHGRSRRALERVFKALNSWGELTSPAQLIHLKSVFVQACLAHGKQAIARCEHIMKAQGGE